MKRRILAAALAAGLTASAGARAALTSSETAEVRGYVASETHADRVRALVARPDLSADESAAAMTAALAGVSLDERRLAFLDEVVTGAPSAASRPVLALATVRGVLARAEAVYAQHPADLERAADLADVARAYGWVAAAVAGGTEAVRADCARAMADHLARESSLLRLDVPVPAAVAKVRAQAALALFDAMPDGPARRVEVADKLGLTGARRGVLVGMGLLVLDGGSGEGRVGDVRALLDRLPGAREGAEAVFVGDSRARFRARARVVSTDDAPDGPLTAAASPWGDEAAPPAVEARTLAVARGLAAAVVHDALDRRPSLRGAVEREGEASVAAAAAMLVLDAPRTVEVAAARSLAGKRELLASVADALGALAVFAPAGPVADALAMPLGQGRATHVSLDPTGVAAAFHLAGSQWRIDRDATGAVTGLRRDGAPIVASMLHVARSAATQATSWSGAGLVLARLAGAPRVAIAAGPRVRLVGSSVSDAVSAPAPGDDVAVEADLAVDGGPAGVVVRAVPGANGFRGVSLVIVPGAPPHAVLLAADGAGADLALSPPVEIPAAATFHVRLVARGAAVEAKLGASSWSAALPAELAHGDAALRAYPGATVEASSWRVAKP
jgi:hypothetical protein